MPTPGVVIDLSGPRWKITFTADISGGGVALPATLWPGSLAPNRINWVSPNANPADGVVIQAHGKDVFVPPEATGVDFGSYEERPKGYENWPGPITVTRFDSGECLISP